MLVYKVYITISKFRMFKDLYLAEKWSDILSLNNISNIIIPDWID